MAWKRGDLAGALGRLKMAFVLAAIAVLGTWAIITGESLLPLLGMALVVWLLVGALVELAERLRLFRAPLGESWMRARHLPRAAYGMTIAHMGVALVVLGITASGTWSSDKLGVMRPGDSAAVGPYTFTLLDVLPARGPNYDAQRASIRVERGGELVTIMHPETRHYPVPPTDTTEVALRSSPIADLYAVVGEPDGKGGYAVRLYHKPLVSWIWLGAVVMVLGGALSLSDRRHRIGAPSAKRRAAALAAAPAE
jgi:cytochrome c-type biogenesis protein CcmF